jgi:hypothetical protein
MLCALHAALLGFSAMPLHVGRVAPARVALHPQMGVMDVVNSVKDSVVPSNSDQTLRNAFGYQALGWGAAGLLAPTYLSANVLGVTATTASNMLMRGMALSNLALATRFTGGSDADAATTGVVWFGLWYWCLNNAVSSGAFGGMVPMVVTWNAIMALVAARRRGGIWSTVTNADTELLDGLLPKDFDTSMRNFVGMQMSAWGVGLMFFASKVNSILGIATTPVLSALGVGLALTNLVLGGKVMAGTDNDAAANGVLFFGGWAVLNYMGKAAGVLTGANVGLLTLWNAACGAYCAYKLL